MENEQESKKLIDLLEFELTRIKAEESKSGWSTRVLLASTASLVWLLTIELEKNQHNWSTALYIFLIAWIGEYAIRSLRVVAFSQQSLTLRLALVSLSSGTVLLLAFYDLLRWVFALYIFLQFATVTARIFSIVIITNIVSVILLTFLVSLLVPLISTF